MLEMTMTLQRRDRMTWQTVSGEDRVGEKEKVMTRQCLWCQTDANSAQRRQWTHCVTGHEIYGACGSVPERQAQIDRSTNCFTAVQVNKFTTSKLLFMQSHLCRYQHEVYDADSEIQLFTLNVFLNFKRLLVRINVINLEAMITM